MDYSKTYSVSKAQKICIEGEVGARYIFISAANLETMRKVTSNTKGVTALTSTKQIVNVMKGAAYLVDFDKKIKKVSKVL